MSIQSLERLEAWSKSRDFSLRIYREVLPVLPSEEKWNLNAQLRRSALSIPANVAEGFGRFYYQDNVRFCYNARGSLEETLSHLVIASRMNYIPETLFVSLEQDGEKLTQLINGYISYLKRTKQGESEPGAKHTVSEEPSEYESSPGLEEIDNKTPTILE